MELADEFERGMSKSNSAAADEGELLDFDDKDVLSQDEQEEAVELKMLLSTLSSPVPHMTTC